MNDIQDIPPMLHFSFLPALTENGFSNRKTVCFQCVVVLWGPVENKTCIGRV